MSVGYGELHEPDQVSLEWLLSIWPITTSIARSTAAGDLIALSRSSSTLRALTHGLPIGLNSPKWEGATLRCASDLQIGNHQTRHWTNLKSLASFSCSDSSHREPKPSANTKTNVVRPCKFCSKPVCKTCIVRSFFADPKQSKNTFRYRTRYLCSKCWETGNLRKDFRYPAEHVTREHIWRGQSYGQRGGRCSCSASEDNWLCRECRHLQNISGPSNSSLSDAERRPAETMNRGQQTQQPGAEHDEMNCYGLDCNKIVEDHTKERRRICLWCSKSLPRQFAGEERLRWEERQVEARAAAAASRSADIYEWARNRFRTLTMSRRQMRGTEACILLTARDGPDHDKPIFVRHLDAVNYRQVMHDGTAPTPDQVYQSKNGRWTYSLEFLKSVGKQILTSTGGLPPPSWSDSDYFFDLTSANGLEMARRNRELRFLPSPSISFLDSPRSSLIRLAAQLYEAGLMNQYELHHVANYHWSSFTNISHLLDDIYKQYAVWEAETQDQSGLKTRRKFGELLIESKATIKRSGVKVPVEPPPDIEEDIDVPTVPHHGSFDSSTRRNAEQEPSQSNNTSAHGDIQGDEQMTREDLNNNALYLPSFPVSLDSDIHDLGMGDTEHTPTSSHSA